MQERQRIVPQERDVGVVDKRRQIERIAEERRQEVSAAGEERQEEELDDVEVEIEGEECPIGDLCQSCLVSRILASQS